MGGDVEKEAILHGIDFSRNEISQLKSGFGSADVFRMKVKKVRLISDLNDANKLGPDFVVVNIVVFQRYFD